MSDREPDETVIPVIEEQVRVDKREKVTGRVQVRTELLTRTEHVETELLHQEVKMVRVPVNRPVEAVPEVRTEGDVTIFPVVEEVVIKQLFLKEEVHVFRERRTERHAEDVTLYRADVVSERLPGEG